MKYEQSIANTWGSDSAEWLYAAKKLEATSLYRSRTKKKRCYDAVRTFGPKRFMTGRASQP